MDFPFDVNKVLPHEITLIRSKDIFLDVNKDGIHRNSKMQVKLHLCKIIDAMGIASGKAQNLRGSITSALRMKSSDHHLYLLKDASGNNGSGSVVGLLKIGFKHLFLVDNYGQQHECQPYCVLDFYVHETKQRHGYGKIIFNFMLRSEQLNPHELAIDRPSNKFVNFLARHYSLDKPIQQLNKFIVFDSFFKDMSVVGGITAKCRRSAPVNRKFSNRTPTRQDTRFCASARLNKLLHPIREPIHNNSHHSRQLLVLPPIQVSDEYVESTLNQKPIAHQSSVSNIRSHYPKSMCSETQIRNFSRHGVKLGSNSYPNIPLNNNNDDEIETLSNNNKLQANNNNMETHTMKTSSEGSQQVTSLDNPLNTVNQASGGQNNDDKSYTVDKVLSRLNANKEKLGTSWNVFGVPSRGSSRNPYSSMQRRGFLN